MLLFSLFLLILHLCNAADSENVTDIQSTVTITQSNYSDYETIVTDASKKCSSNNIVCTSLLRHVKSGSFFAVVHLTGDGTSYTKCLQTELGSINNTDITFKTLDGPFAQCKQMKGATQSFQCFNESVCGSTSPTSSTNASASASPRPTGTVGQAKVQSDLSSVQSSVTNILNALDGLKTNSNSNIATAKVLSALGDLDDANSNLFNSLALLAGVNATLRKRDDVGPFGPFVSQIALNSTSQQVTALNGLTNAFQDVDNHGITTNVSESGASYANAGNLFLTTYGLSCSAGDLNSAINQFNAVYGGSASLVNQSSNCTSTTNGATTSTATSTKENESTTTSVNSVSSTSSATTTTQSHATESASVGDSLCISLGEIFLLIGLEFIL